MLWGFDCFIPPSWFVLRWGFFSREMRAADGFWWRGGGCRRGCLWGTWFCLVWFCWWIWWDVQRGGWGKWCGQLVVLDVHVKEKRRNGAESKALNDMQIREIIEQTPCFCLWWWEKRKQWTKEGSVTMEMQTGAILRWQKEWTKPHMKGGQGRRWKAFFKVICVRGKNAHNNWLAFIAASMQISTCRFPVSDSSKPAALGWWRRNWRSRGRVRSRHTLHGCSRNRRVL